MNHCRYLWIAALCVAACGARAESIAIVNARILTMGAAGEVNPGTVLVSDTDIVAVGRDVAIPADARIVDAKGRIVTPGLVLPASGLGLVEIRNGAPALDDRDCEDPCRGATFDVGYALNPDSTLIPAARLGGITRAVVIPEPGADLLAGHAAAIRLADDGEILVKPRVATVLYLGQLGAARAGGSRAAAIVALRSALQDAAELADRRRDDPSAQFSGGTLSTRELAALVRVAKGETPLLIAVHRAEDIRQVLAIGEEYRLRLVLLGAEEGWRVADEIARTRTPVILNPTHSGPNAFESIGTSLDNARLLNEAGVTIAVRGNGPHRAREARYNAGNAVANGLPWHAALQAITVNPARLFGLEDRFGSIAAGRAADLVLWDGDPLESLTTPVMVLIAGVEQPLSSRGTLLRDRYLRLDEDYPPAYR